MKKTYISPSFITVKLAPSKTLAYSGPDIKLNAGGETSTFDAREYNNSVRDVNLWNNEW